MAPYWRLALQKEWEHHYLMIGTFGLHGSLFPDVLTGPRNTYTDVGADAQFEYEPGPGTSSSRGSWIHEHQTLDATVACGRVGQREEHAQGPADQRQLLSAAVAGRDGRLFRHVGHERRRALWPDPVDGSANGSPKTNGFIGEVDLNPWENTRVGLQYTAYSNFNGGKTDYDGSGGTRRATTRSSPSPGSRSDPGQSAGYC